MNMNRFRSKVLESVVYDRLQTGRLVYSKPMSRLDKIFGEYRKGVDEVYGKELDADFFKKLQAYADMEGSKIYELNISGV